jgi:hypothetical protein
MRFECRCHILYSYSNFCFRCSAESAKTSQEPLPMPPDSGNNSQSMYQGLDFDNSASDTNHQYTTLHSGESTMTQQTPLPGIREAGNNSQNTYQGLDFEKSASDTNTHCYTTLAGNAGYSEDGGNNLQPKDVSNTYLTAVMSPPSSCPGEEKYVNNPTSHDHQHYINVSHIIN